MWPLDESGWRDLLQPLPRDADRAGVRQAIEAAVREYVDGANRDEQFRRLWLQIKRTAGSRQIEKLCRAILQLKTFPLDPVAEAMLRQVEALARMRSDADLRAAIYLSTARRGRFMSRLSLVWTGMGKSDLPISDTGPFVDFMAAITALVFSRPLDGSAVKRFVKREKARRETLLVLDQLFVGEGGIKADSFVIDAAGQHKSG
jgi:hypothetical protein